ncbi:hypothetical protein [Actinomadura parmotrematis]|uniref:DUF4333 domain-containing protein n=1 Tax=Actinomadura parmotrematis TaxID=2864039 RepID=A0ABS7FQU8_9ACTN|nr:hypothetical protein [Actinomadura parmotrematis]MBW8482779.1 hypothetical protein [Actinomadura parmotrematis]
MCLVLTGGCSGDGGKDAWAGRGRPVAVPSEPAPTRTPEGVANGVSGIRVALQGRVLATAGVVRPVRSQCSTPAPLPAFTCQVTLLGQTVTYQVTSEPQSGTIHRWTARPDALIVTRTGVERALWDAYAPRATAIRCDPVLPEQQRVAPLARLKQRCYVKPTAADPGLGAAGRNRARTVAVQITVHDGRVSFTEHRQ